MNCVMCVVMPASDTILVLAGTLMERNSTPHYSSRIEGKNLIHFCVGTIVVNYFLISFSLLFPHMVVG